MSLLTAPACCCDEDPECFFGVKSTDGATACNHTTTEFLEYRRGRPAYTTGHTRLDYSECDCEGTYVTATGYSASPAVFVKYEHFQNNDPDKVWTWYYKHWQDVWPTCKDPCCGHGNDDEQCCAGTTSLCSGTYKNAVGGKASKYQASVIGGGTADKESLSDDAADCEYGDEFEFLEGVSNRSTAEYYEHYGVNASGQVMPVVYRHLAETVIAVFHREHWYKRFYNSLDINDNEDATPEDTAAARCATPRFFAFGCSGCWVGSGEVKSSSLDSTIGSGTADSFLIKVNAGEPVPEAWLDVLVSDGIIDIGDHGQAGGELIKKTLSHYNSRGQGPTTETAYFHARPGGWTFICADFVATNDDDALDDNFPQIPRRSSVTCETGADNCHTAAPIPGNNETTCQNEPGYGDAATLTCNPCGDDQMGNCGLPLVASCGLDSNTDTCQGDVVVSSCRGFWAQHWEYVLPKATEAYTLNYLCHSDDDGTSHNAYLCRIPNATKTCDWDELPDEMHHDMPTTVSGSVRNGTSDGTKLCCGGVGMYRYNSAECPGNGPDAPDACDEPPEWAPDL